MTQHESVHGFTSVDSQSDPARWVRCLDILQAHPFFISYKRRIRELIAPRPRAAYLDVGAGTGYDALAITRDTGAIVVAIDASRTMASEARHRGLRTSVVGTALNLPFPDSVFDGCWADRVFQHLRYPEISLKQLVRVTKPQGRIVVIDPDYGTQALCFPDQPLAEKVLRFRTQYGLRNGALAGSMANLFTAEGLVEVRRESSTLIVHNAAELDDVFGLRSWARAAQRTGLLSDREVLRWEALFDETVSCGSFCWQVTFMLTTGLRRT